MSNIGGSGMEHSGYFELVSSKKRRKCFLTPIILFSRFPITSEPEYLYVWHDLQIPSLTYNIPRLKKKTMTDKLSHKTIDLHVQRVYYSDNLFRL